MQMSNIQNTVSSNPPIVSSFPLFVSPSVPPPLDPSSGDDVGAALPGLVGGCVVGIVGAICPFDIVGYAVVGIVGAAVPGNVGAVGAVGFEPDVDVVGDGTFPATGADVGSFVKTGFETGEGVIFPHNAITFGGHWFQAILHI